MEKILVKGNENKYPSIIQLSLQLSCKLAVCGTTYCSTVNCAFVFAFVLSSLYKLYDI